MTISVPSLPCLEAPEAAPWIDSEAWLMVFLKTCVSGVSRETIWGRRGAYLTVSILDVKVN